VIRESDFNVALRRFVKAFRKIVAHLREMESFVNLGRIKCRQEL